MINKNNLTEELVKTAHCFRLGKDGEGNLNLSKILEFYILKVEKEKQQLPLDIINKIENIHIELNKRNYIRIADILEFELIKY